MSEIFFPPESTEYFKSGRERFCVETYLPYLTIRSNAIWLARDYVAPEFYAKQERKMHHHFPDSNNFSGRNFNYSSCMRFWVWIWHHWRVKDSSWWCFWGSVSRNHMKLGSPLRVFTWIVSLLEDARKKPESSWEIWST